MMHFFKIVFAIITIFIALKSPKALAIELSQGNVSTNDIMREIEKTLLFNDSQKSPNEIMQEKINQKSNFTLVANKKDNERDDIKIKVKDSKKTIDLDLRTKERMAYNATLNGQYEVAIELYKQVASQEPENNYALFSLATIYQKIGQFRQAKAVYYKLLQNEPENKEEVIANILSTILEESPREALYLMTKLSKTNPKSSYILVQTALAYSAVKNYVKAEELMLQAIALNNNRVDYKYNLAIIYDNAKNYEKAFAFYQQVIRDYNEEDAFCAAISLEAVKLRLETIKNKI